MSKKANKTNSKLIIIIAMAILITAISFSACKSNEPPADTSFNITEIKCNTGKKLDDSDLKDIEDIVKEIAGDKFRKVEKNDGIFSAFGAPTLPADENGEEKEFDVGDSVYIVCMLLEEQETLDIITAIANKYDFIHDYGYDFEKNAYMISYNPLYAPEYK